jgi:hypothetical protein
MLAVAVHGGLVEDGDVLRHRVSFQLPHHLGAVHVGQHNVKHDGVGGLPRKPKRIASGAGLATSNPAADNAWTMM